ncbi:MAG TPA: ATP-dependent Clp protease ATP-binding subunit [Patescibacteria group bacterium]
MRTNITDKFTTHFKKTLVRASNFASANKLAEVQPEHVLYGLLTQRGSIGCEILTQIKLTSDKVRAKIVSRPVVSQAAGRTPETVISQETKQLIYKAVLTANLYQHKYVGTEHLLASLLEIKNPVIRKIFSGYKIDFKTLESKILSLLKSTSKFPDLTETFSALKEHQLAERGYETSRGSVLDAFTTDLTDKKIQKNIDPVIARELEIERLIQILSRRTKNNPLLLGDPGVGKTAIVEGLAKRIINQEVPDILLNKKILSLDLGLIIAGTMYRGEFESRLKQLLEEIKHDPNVILFIDEIHNIIGTGSTSGTLDMANLLKPALARGEIRCIGATTYEEYRKYIQKDIALERRFQPIKVAEPTVQETVSILDGLKQNYEQFHRVLIDQAALNSAVNLSDRYIQDRFLPDKAIDLIDEACSRVKVKNQNSQLQRQINTAEKHLEEVKYRKQKAVFNEDFKKAIHYKKQEEILVSELVALQKIQEKEADKFIGQVTAADIQGVISKMTGIPLENLKQREKQKILGLEDSLNQKIIGQREAVRLISQVIRRSRTGLCSPQRPIGSFMFLGPSGVGKTHTAKTLAGALFENKNSLIRIDMSEFGEKFNISKLIGSPAGYVGYQESGTLTEAVKRQPYSVVLFDEIEKAHRDVFNLLLQILDDGYITDAGGKRVDFKNTIIIMTSNLGSERFKNSAGLGFNGSSSSNHSLKDIKTDLQKELTGYFRPEFLNRIDQVVIFELLTSKDLEAVAELQIKELISRLKQQKIEIQVSPAVFRFIGQKKTEEDLGARAIIKNIRELIENPLSEFLLREEINEKEPIKISLKNKNIIFKN